MIVVTVVGFSALLTLFLMETPSESNMSDGREDLKEVAYSNTICSNYYITEFFDMLDDQNYDYRNDPIFQECSQVLEFERYADTAYDPNPEQLEAISEYCIDSKDLVDTKGLSYSNDTHYIDTVTCEWKKLENLWETGGQNEK